ncbi:MAG: hypothetical protein L0G70_01145 [Rubrobacter sp.]|nr:hypothetical protein [Rubrobacter sp.]
MPQTCTVCSHEKRAEIDEAIICRAGNRRIATQYGLTESAVRRHANSHLPELLAKGREAEEHERARELLYDLDKLQAHTLKVLRAAENAGPEFMGLVLRAVAEQRKNLELRFKAADWKEIELRLDELEEAQKDGD